jgi:CBS domain-containing protein
MSRGRILARGEYDKMKVEEVMTKEIISVDKDVELELVLKLMKKHDITKIPVLEEKKLIGIVTDNLIAYKLGAIRTRGIPASRLHVSSVTEKNVVTISPGTNINDVLKEVGEPGLTMLPVVEKDKLVGVLTKADLLPLVKSKKKIREIMHKRLVAISPSDRVIHARRQMIDEKVARLPVLNQGKLVGMISDTEIAFALAELKTLPLGRQKHRLDELTVSEVMKTPVVWTEGGISAEEAAKIMLKHNVGALPILEDNKIVGLVTRTDLIRTIN